MLNVRNKKFNPFKPKKMNKKAGILTTIAKKNRALLDFFSNLVSRFSLILTKI